MNLARFELSRLSRQYAVFAAWLALAVVAVVELVNLPDRLPSMVRLWPLPVIYIAGWALADDLRRGALDVLVSRGVSLPQLLMVRIVLAASLGVLTLTAISLPVLAGGGADRALALDMITVVVYWAALGAVLGFFSSSGALVALALVGGVAEAWWASFGCGWLTGDLPSVGWRGLVTFLLHLASPFVARDVPLVSEVFRWESLRIVAAAAVLLAGYGVLSRRSLFGAEEG
jgi:hypothetical protein